MPHDQLLQYIHTCKEKDISNEVILESLVAAGWLKEDVQQALFIIDNPSIPLPPSPSGHTKHEIAPPQPSLISSNGNMKETLEYIVLFISMYISIIAAALILHTLIDIWFPDSSTIIDSTASMQNAFTFMNGYIASLIVTFPIFSFLFIRIKRRELKHHIKKNIRAHRLLVFLTLIFSFFAGLSTVISFASIVITGDISWNAFFHFFVSLVFSGGIFLYFLYQVKDDGKNNA